MVLMFPLKTVILLLVLGGALGFYVGLIIENYQIRREMIKNRWILLQGNFKLIGHIEQKLKDGTWVQLKHKGESR